MVRKSFTLIEVVLVIALLAVIVAFTYPELGAELRRRSLVESADRLRTLIVMAHAQAMLDSRQYLIEFPGTPNPNDPKSDSLVDVPHETLQPMLLRQEDPLEMPHAYYEYFPSWARHEILLPGTRCVAVLPGRPWFGIDGSRAISGPSVSDDQMTEFVPLTLYPNGTTDWVTFVLTDLPPDIQVEAHHAPRIINVIVDGRTGKAWMQRALRMQEVELMEEMGASPLLHMDFTRADEITKDNVLHVQTAREGAVGGRQTAQP
jgi:prepilin-type N-terminal cleavage/methylation domain-containing protein